MPTTSFRTRLNRCAWLLSLALAAGLPLAHSAGMRPEEKVPSERLTAVLQAQFKPAQDATDWVKALAVVDAELPKAAPDSYDEFFLHDLRAKVINSSFETRKLESIPNFERALELSDANEIYSPQELEITLVNLAQNLYDKAQQIKDNPAERLRLMDRAIGYFRRNLESARIVRANLLEYFAQVLMYRFDAEQDKPESQKFLNEAIDFANKALTYWPERSSDGFKPRDSLYTLLFQAYLVKQDYEKAISYVELMLAQNPTNEQIHKNLLQIYGNLALGTGDTAKDTRKVNEWTLAALGAYKRAQDAGFAKTPRDNAIIMSLLANLGKFGLAAEKLEQDLKAGTQENTEAYWGQAAVYYRTDNRPEKAIEVLKEGAAKFPRSGMLEFQAAGIYIQMGDGKNALEMAKKALEKGMGENAYKAWGMIAYAAFDQQDFEQSRNAIAEAMKNPKAVVDDTRLLQFKDYIDSVLEDRERRKTEALKK